MFQEYKLHDLEVALVRSWSCFVLILVAGLCIAAKPREERHPPAGPITIRLWPKGAPGRTANIGPEQDITKPGDPLVAGKRVIRLTDISNPTITIFEALRNKNSGTAVMVLPGGGYQVLAMDLEGTEVCKWLRSVGITAVLLKYRVPSRKGFPRYTAPLQDAQRALGIIRTNASEWHINPHRIGVLGFSAGGDLAAELSNNYRKRTYQPTGPADRTSCRPDFAKLIYPAYLVVKEDGSYRLSPEINVTEDTPPTFLVQTEDDPIGVQNSIFYYLALEKNHVPAEMHLYAAGGHGYGVRRTKATVTAWPDQAEQWLRSHGLVGTP